MSGAPRAAGIRLPVGVGVATLLVATAFGCSEKPLPGTLVWESVPNLPLRLAYLNAVVALSNDRVLAIGNAPPEGAPLNRPLAMVKSGGAFTLVYLPSPANGWSAALLDATKASDGSVWVCGRTFDYEPDPSRIQPLVYAYVAGVWTESAITDAGDLEGTILTGIASARRGENPEIRAVGDRRGGRGIAIRRLAGRWTLDSLPVPSAPGKGWRLGKLAQARDGDWYAGGSTANGDGLLYVDDGGGWRLATRWSGYPMLLITALEFDTEGVLWMAGNYSFGDSLEGALFRLRNGSMSRVPIARVTTGGHTIFDLEFDAEGHGWLVGGRSGYLPFVAGTTGGPWTEVIAEIEKDLVAPGEFAETGGGDLLGVDVVGETYAVAVGYKILIGKKGILEAEPGIYQLGVRPLGEIDLRTGPPPPNAVRASRGGSRTRIRRP